MEYKEVNNMTRTRNPTKWLKRTTLIAIVFGAITCACAYRYDLDADTIIFGYILGAAAMGAIEYFDGRSTRAT